MTALNEKAAGGDQAADSNELLSLKNTKSTHFQEAVSLPSALEFLKEKSIWVIMECREEIDEKTGELKSRKMPISPINGEAAASDKPQTWGTFNQAAHLLQRCRSRDASKRYHLAIALYPELNVIFVDLDKVRDPETETIESWAQEIIDDMGSYTELSQSGKGVHILGYGQKWFEGCRKGKIEIYNSGRFCIVTGEALSDALLNDVEAKAEAAAEKFGIKKKPQVNRVDFQVPLSLDDDGIVRKARSAKNGSHFSALYDAGDLSSYDGDPSRGDLGLCSLIAFYTQDRAQIDRIFRTSALFRPKWDTREDYRDRTLSMALSNRTESNSYKGRSTFGYDTATDNGDETKAKESPMETPIFTSEELQKAIADNECGDADLFKKHCSGDVLFDVESDRFYQWNGTIWVVDHKNAGCKQRLRKIADAYDQESEKISSMFSTAGDQAQQKSLTAKSKDLKKRSHSLRTDKRMNAVLNMSKTEQMLFTGKWDNCPGFLTCANGIVDLSNGRLSESSRDRYIREHATYQYNENAKCPAFDRFLLEIMGDDVELVSFLKRLFGYAIIGVPKEHKFIFFYGASGRNGKGTLLNTICSVIGPFAHAFSPELILLQRNPPSSGNPRPDLIHLKNRRIAAFSEINPGRQIDSAILKNLSGGDTISARRLFSNVVENFAPTHTIFMLANHRPEAPADDTALWSRAIVVPFGTKFVENPTLPHERKLDPNLNLLKEAQGILRWLVEGSLEFAANGLRIPPKISAAVEDYRRSNDGIGEFIRERCEVRAGRSEKCLTLRDEVKKYCTEEGYTVPTKNEITEYLKTHGFSKVSLCTGDRWSGIKIKSDTERRVE